MATQGQPPRRRKKNQQPSGNALVLKALGVVLALLVLLALLFRGCMAMVGRMASDAQTEVAVTQPLETEPIETAPSETELPEAEPAPTVEAAKLSFWQRLFGSKQAEREVEAQPQPEETAPSVVSTAKISVLGDVILHKRVFTSGLQSDGSYDLNFIFKYVKPQLQAADFAVANLETSLCGTQNGYEYQSYPQFNSPDEIVDAAKNAGIDMLLTANNHCYDTGEVGFLRTLQVVRDKGLIPLGTRATHEEPKYRVEDINGIKVGMVCYTYENTFQGAKADRKYLNGIPVAAGSEDLVNSFFSARLPAFYQEIGDVISQMKADGAEATVVFIHWGTEYETTQNSEQQEIAQQLADLEVDVIVGGHPHVVQPVALLSSRNSDHKTVCIYSLGNAVSNQRREEMKLKTGHTEDGVLFTMQFEKKSDGAVRLSDVDALPCWVDLRENGQSVEYNILPLEESRKEAWSTEFSMSTQAVGKAEQSLDRTNAIIGSGLQTVKQYLKNP